MLHIKQIRTDFDHVEAKLKTRGISPDNLYELKDLNAKNGP